MSCPLTVDHGLRDCPREADDGGRGRTGLLDRPERPERSGDPRPHGRPPRLGQDGARRFVRTSNQFGRVVRSSNELVALPRPDPNEGARSQRHSRPARLFGRELAFRRVWAARGSLQSAPTWERSRPLRAGLAPDRARRSQPVADELRPNLLMARAAPPLAAARGTSGCSSPARRRSPDSPSPSRGVELRRASGRCSAPSSAR